MGTSVMVPPALHCNLGCPKCGHASPFIKEKFIDIDTTLKSIDILIKRIGLTNVRISGGEPLIFPDILNFLSLLKVRNLTIRLITNGLLLDKVWPAVIKYVDTIVVSDLKMNKPEIPKDIAKNVVWRDPGNFKDIFAPQGNPNPLSSFRKCTTRIKCACIFDHYFYPCPQSLFFPFAFSYIPTHRIFIEDSSNFEIDYNLIINTDIEFVTCSYCWGNDG
jgi:hypothetical protein